MEVFMCILSVCIAVIDAVSLKEFYPYDLSVNQQLIANDDASSRAVVLDPPLAFFGRTYNSCKIHNNGLVALNTPPEHFLEEPLPIFNHTFIAPFYGDVDTRSAGTVWFTDPVATDSYVIDRVAGDIRSAFEDQTPFVPAYALIATWDHVGYFKEKSDKLNTFQCIITSDGNASFAIFLYNQIQWTSPDDSNSGPKHAKIGFNEATLTMSWTMPCSRTINLTEIPDTSNVGVPGKWIFRIDRDIFSTCLDDYKVACESDPFCSCSTPDPRQICQCNVLNKSIQECDSATLPPVTTEGGRNSTPVPTTEGGVTASDQSTSKCNNPAIIVFGVVASLLSITVTLTINKATGNEIENCTGVESEGDHDTEKCIPHSASYQPSTSDDLYEHG